MSHPLQNVDIARQAEKFVTLMNDEKDKQNLIAKQDFQQNMKKFERQFYRNYNDNLQQEKEAYHRHLNSLMPKKPTKYTINELFQEHMTNQYFP